MGALPAGSLDRRVTLQRVQRVDDGFSKDVSSTALDLGKRWMSKRDVSDAEQMRAAAVGAIVTTRFQARWDALTSTITTADRLAYDDVVYEITGIKEIGRREGIEFTTKAAR